MREVLFDMEVTLCTKFPAMSPLNIQKERAADVFSLMGDLLRHLERENIRKAKEIKRGGKKKNVIRIPAGDDWF